MMKSLVHSFLVISFFMGPSLISVRAQAADGAFCSSLPDPNAQAVAPIKNPDDVGKDEAGRGLENDCAQIRTSIEQQMLAQIQSWQAMGLQTPNQAKIREGYQRYKSNRNGCLNGQMRAATICLEGWSPNLAETSAQINMGLTAMGAQQSSNQSCGKMADLMKLAQTGLTAYSGACGVAKAGCGLSCVRARGGLESMAKAIEAETSSASCAGAPDAAACAQADTAYKQLLSQAAAAVQNELAIADKKSIAGKAGACNSKYAALAASALAGTAGILGVLKQGNDCEQKTAAVDDIATKCALEENASLPDCICLKNPRSAGCSNAYEKLGEERGLGVAGTGQTDRTNSVTKASAGMGDMPSTGIEQAERSPSKPGSLPGAPQGGGPGISGSTGGGGRGGGQAGGPQGGSGLSTDVLSGSGGGGGGGGSWGRGVSSTDSSGYRAYLPGGKQDPSRAMAGQQAWTREVTGQGGKSNFDKVKDRYRDNKNSLLGN